MEEIEITIVNWEKYQKVRKDTKNPYWVAVHNELWRCAEFSTFTAEEKLVWYSLLQLASKLRKPKISVDTAWFAKCCGVTEKSVVNSVNKMHHLGWVRTESVQIPCKSRTGFTPDLRPTIHNNTKQERKKEEKQPINSDQNDSFLTQEDYDRIEKEFNELSSMLKADPPIRCGNEPTPLPPIEKIIDAFSGWCNDKEWLRKTLPIILLEYDAFAQEDDFKLAMQKYPPIVRIRQMTMQRWKKENKPTRVYGDV